MFYSRKFSLALLFLFAPLVEASTILPEQIRIDIHSKPEQINLNAELDFYSSDTTTTVEVLFFGAFFQTYFSKGSDPLPAAYYFEPDPEITTFDLSHALRRFLFEERYGDQTYDFINRVSLEDTYLFGFGTEVYYTPNDCNQFEDDCPPTLAASGYGETLVTFYDSQQGPENPTEVGLPGSLPLTMIGVLGVFLRQPSRCRPTNRAPAPEAPASSD